MSEEQSQTKSLVPHIAIAVVVVAALTGIYFWLDKEPVPQPEPIATVIPTPDVVADTIEPVVQEQQEPEQEPEYEAPLPEPEPIDVSDGAIKSSLLELSENEIFGRLLVNEALLQRFVVYVSNLANHTIADNNQVLVPPEQEFRVYQQAGKEWIDASSYKRYSPYVDILESIDANNLTQLYQKYQGPINDVFGEISSSGGSFDRTLVKAIDELLDTPEVPVPVEVYTDSVMYRYTDERLESLTAPQKQLLRTGPENMRRIKAKLREIKQALEEE
jgi:hypothetical protein